MNQLPETITYLEADAWFLSTIQEAPAAIRRPRRSARRAI